MYAVSSGLSQSSSKAGAQTLLKISLSCERFSPGSSSVPVRSTITHGFASAAICATRLRRIRHIDRHIAAPRLEASEHARRNFQLLVPVDQNRRFPFRYGLLQISGKRIGPIVQLPVGKRPSP